MRAIVRDAVLLGAAVGVFGASFGVLAATSGLSVAKTCAVSLLVFTGASQFAAVGVVAAGGSIASALGSALLLAGRNAAYGLAVSGLFRGDPLPHRLVAAQLTVDETTAMATAHADRALGRRAFWATALSLYTFWNVGTLLGAVVGNAIGDPATFGLDAAFPAGFIALMAPHLRRRRGRVAALAGAVIALGLVPLTPAGTPILAAAAAVVPALFLRDDA